jgi:DNA-binding transcriptional LysR family regulator
MGGQLRTIDLRLIPSFVVLADELHFGRAATRLGVAQPALSQQVRRLETQLGKQLFERDSRRVTLTEVGATLLEPSRRALALVESGLRAAWAAGGAVPVLEVGLSTAARAWLAPALEREVIERELPMRLNWHEEFPDTLIAALRDGRFDAAITFCARPDAELEAMELFAAPAHVLLHADDPLASADVLAGPELRGHRVLVPPHGGRTTGFIETVSRVWQTWTGTTPVVEEARTNLCSAIPEPGIAGIEAVGTGFPTDVRTVVVPVAGDQQLPFHVQVRRDDPRPVVKQLMAATLAVADRV